MRCLMFALRTCHDCNHAVWQLTLEHLESLLIGRDERKVVYTGSLQVRVPVAREGQIRAIRVGYCQLTSDGETAQPLCGFTLGMSTHLSRMPIACGAYGVPARLWMAHTACCGGTRMTLWHAPTLS